MWIKHIATQLLRMTSILLLGGFLGAILVRLAPGSGVDEAELDARLSDASIRSLRQSREGEKDVVQFYLRFLSGLLNGDLGVSRSSQPIAELIGERLPVTCYSIGLGLIAGWSLGLALAVPATIFKNAVYDLVSGSISGLFLCLPAATLGLLFLFLDGPAPLALGLVVFPKIFRYVRNVLVHAEGLPHVIAARARGVRTLRLVTWHILPPVLPQVLALVGVSVSMALGASIPVEVICDSPGIGQLAWQAAQGRDLPVLVTLTLLVTLATLLANFAADLGTFFYGEPRS